jgi:membrane-bound metal-dependent hydrolase YbcI (DUF457 family)
MKGISHFISGVTAASFCPWAVEAAMEGNPLYFVLGGAFGVLPDTLDFKFYRFFYYHDIYVEPEGGNPDPQRIAEQAAKAVEMALKEKRTVRLKLSTVRMGADFWRQYSIKFDSEKQEVQVRIGAVVNTGQVPVPGSEPKETQKIGRAKLVCPIVQTYDAVTRVDIFDGPTFAMQPDEQGRVVLHFLPWHRSWTHSFTLGAAFAALGWLIWGWQAAVVIMAGLSVHVLEDQMGLMGSNLFFPITKKRFHGLHLMRAGDSVPNFGVVWTCCLLIFWNLYRHIPSPTFKFTFLQLVFYGAVIPLGAFWLAHFLLTRGKKAEEAVAPGQDEFDEPVAAS